MSRIRSKDTKPEMTVRRFLWAHGYRYSLHSKKLPGHPDIVLRKHKTVIFVNGCFWHGHNTVALEGGELASSECCKLPKSNRAFWLGKINRNRERDSTTASLLRDKGWRIITLWECELKPKNREATLNRLLDQLRPAKQYEIEPQPYSIAAENEISYSCNIDPENRP